VPPVRGCACNRAIAQIRCRASERPWQPARPCMRCSGNSSRHRCGIGRCGGAANFASRRNKRRLHCVGRRSGPVRSFRSSMTSIYGLYRGSISSLSHPQGAAWMACAKTLCKREEIAPLLRSHCVLFKSLLLDACRKASGGSKA